MLVNNPEDATVSYHIACLYCGMGDSEKALEFLEKFLKPGAYQKLFNDWIDNDSDLDPLRDTLKFQELLKKCF